MTAWPADLPEPYLDTPRSICACAKGILLRLQKSTDGLNETPTYDVTLTLPRRSRIDRTLNMPAAVAIRRFVTLYDRHFRPGAGQ